MKYLIDGQIKEFDVKTVVVKVGSMVLTRENDLDLEVIGNLAKLIHRLREQGMNVVLVSSGAIASGLHVMKPKSLPKTIPDKQALAAIGQNYLMSIYSDLFGKQGMKVAQVLLTQDDMDNRKRYLNAKLTIERLLEMGIVPVINENDTVTIDELKFGDNDKLSARVALKLNADLLVLFTDVDGLFTGNPKLASSELIPVVDKISKETYALCSKGKSFLGLGGMASKVEAAELATRAGIYCLIANGNKADSFESIVNGEVSGTIFLPGKNKMSARYSWIAAGRNNKLHKIFVDDGAAKVLRSRKKSLLAAGIKNVEGDFSFGDVVEVYDSESQLIARGLTNYASEEIEKIKGLKSGQIAGAIGSKPYDEVIHRDNLVVL